VVGTALVRLSTDICPPSMVLHLLMVLDSPSVRPTLMVVLLMPSAGVMGMAAVRARKLARVRADLMNCILKVLVVVVLGVTKDKADVLVE